MFSWFEQNLPSAYFLNFILVIISAPRSTEQLSFSFFSDSEEDFSADFQLL